MSEENTMITPEPTPNLRDWGLSWIRTGVPILWGYLLTFLVSRAPAIHDLLANPYVNAAVVGVVTLIWYAVVRWLEPRLPAWLTTLVIGANAAPMYVDARVSTFTGDELPDAPPPAGPSAA